jgi:hypothetical protein
LIFLPENVQALAGVALILGLCWLVSENRKRFPLVLAVCAIAIQLILVFVLFKLPATRDALQGVNGAVEGWPRRPRPAPTSCSAICRAPRRPIPRPIRGPVSCSRSASCR